MLSFCAIFSIIFGCLIIKSTSDENLGQPKFYSANSDDIIFNTNKRFQQIMQGGSPADVGFTQPKLKIEKIDVKAEIAKLNSTYVYQTKWPSYDKKLGAVTAVSFDKDGNVVIFHRVDRIWNYNTFNTKNMFTESSKGPIRQSTVLAFDRADGKLVYHWGKNLFYMPHGLTIDHDDNVWVTDVALHQVMKFAPKGSSEGPLLILGEQFSPGNSDTKFCKPTSVAVLPNGDFFVADGYCNARIIKFSKSGEKILSWGQHTFSGDAYEIAPKNYFAIPHALTLVPEQELICAADRENGRVQCFYSRNGTFHSQYHNQIIGDRLFSMDYTPAEGGQFVIVNGPTPEIGNNNHHYNEVRGYVMKMKTKTVVSKFGPSDLQFENPHDVAVTIDGNEIYVAELDPPRIHKFLHKNVAKSMPMSAAKPTVTSGVGLDEDSDISSAVLSSNIRKSTDNQTNKVRPGSTAMLVASLISLFAFLTFAIALLISRRRKRGKATSNDGTTCDFVYRKLISSSQNVCDDC